MLAKRGFRLLALGLSIALLAGACAPAPQDASKARSRALINRGIIVPAEEVRVAEYLNYYEQHFTPPTEIALSLDLRLGNEQIPTAGGEVWLQIGVQAREAEIQELRHPPQQPGDPADGWHRQPRDHRPGPDRWRCIGIQRARYLPLRHWPGAGLQRRVVEPVGATGQGGLA